MDRTAQYSAALDLGLEPALVAKPQQGQCAFARSNQHVTLLDATVFMSVLLVASILKAHGADPSVKSPCDPPLVQQLHETEREVDSLRPDKAGQARVFAADGSEFTAGQSLWMKAQLESAEQACARADALAAAKSLSGVQELIKAHAPH
jgi:hypothetical protein